MSGGFTNLVAQLIYSHANGNCKKQVFVFSLFFQMVQPTVWDVWTLTAGKSHKKCNEFDLFCDVYFFLVQLIVGFKPVSFGIYLQVQTYS